MMKYSVNIISLTLVLVSQPLVADSLRIAFGSCYDQRLPSEEVFRAIADTNPDLFIFTGDNVYIDSEDPAKFAQDYGLLANNKGFAELRAQTDVMAIWDDHDYGMNDGGKNYSAKQLGKQFFVDFFDYPELKNIPIEQGIQHARRIAVGDKTVQLILLDTRWYRDDLLLNTLDEATQERFQLGPYRPHWDTTKDLLGAAQWQWLEKQLQQPADLNIIASSIQIIAEYTAWETWANFPHERKRLLDLIRRYSPGNALFISGDVHRSETSVINMGDWSIYEVTASGLTADMYPGKPNIYRIGEVIVENNFGMLEINFDDDKTLINTGFYNKQGKQLSNLSFSTQH